jgi:hypothetical protein
MVRENFVKTIFIFILLGVITMAVRSSLPRGIKNNNPGNIRKTADQWEGMKAIQSDNDFVQFTAPVYGFRAMTRILRNYERRGLVTVRDIISTYAPSIENDTESYIKFVSDRLQVSPDQELDFAADLLPLIKSIATFEQGIAYASFFTDDTIQAGIALA